MKKILKLIGINLIVLIGILLLVNIAAISIFQGFQLYQAARSDVTRSGDRRATLPNYSDIPWAKTHFEEFAALSSEYRSYYGWRRLPFEGRTIVINEKGVRITPQHELMDPEQAKLVVFLGGSTMWGTGSNNEHTIPAHFAKLGGGHYRVLNFGEAGYNAFQSYLFLQIQMMQGLRPDVIISYDGANERARFQPGTRPFTHDRDRQITEIMKGQDKGAIKELSFKHFFLGPVSRFVEKLQEKFGTKAPDQFDFSRPRAEQAARELLESWLAMQRLAEDYDAEFLAVLQPNAATGSPKLDYLNLREYRLEAYRALYPEVRRLLETSDYSILKKNILPLTEVFDRDEAIYIDFCHVSPNGNRLVAERIYHVMNQSK